MFEVGGTEVKRHGFFQVVQTGWRRVCKRQGWRPGRDQVRKGREDRAKELGFHRGAWRGIVASCG